MGPDYHIVGGARPPYSGQGQTAIYWAGPDYHIVGGVGQPYSGWGQITVQWAGPDNRTVGLFVSTKFLIAM